MFQRGTGNRRREFLESSDCLFRFLLFARIRVPALVGVRVFEYSSVQVFE